MSGTIIIHGSSPKHILDKISGLENNQIDIDLSDFDGEEG